MKLRFDPHPWPRLLLALVATIAASLSRCWVDGVIVASVSFALLAIQGFALQALRFLVRIWLPLAVMLVIVWGVIVRAPPNEIAGTNPAGGWDYGVLIAFRLAAMALVFQALLLPLRGLGFAAFLARLGLPASAVAGICSIIELWPEFSARANTIVAARCARGLMPDRSVWSRIKQIRYTVRTLFLGALSQSLDRAERWEAERLPIRLIQTATAHVQGGTVSGSIFWVVIVSAFAAWVFWKEVAG